MAPRSDGCFLGSGYEARSTTEPLPGDNRDLSAEAQSADDHHIVEWMNCRKSALHPLARHHELGERHIMPVWTSRMTSHIRILKGAAGERTRNGQGFGTQILNTRRVSKVHYERQATAIV